MNSYKGPEQNKNNNYADVDVDRFDDSIDSNQNEKQVEQRNIIINKMREESVATAHSQYITPNIS